jgi:hypothetical protein
MITDIDEGAKFSTARRTEGKVLASFVAKTAHLFVGAALNCAAASCLKKVCLARLTNIRCTKVAGADPCFTSIVKRRINFSGNGWSSARTAGSWFAVQCYASHVELRHGWGFDSGNGPRLFNPVDHALVLLLDWFAFAIHQHSLLVFAASQYCSSL